MLTHLRDLMAYTEWANAVFFHIWGKSPARDHEELRRRVGHIIGVQEAFLALLRGAVPGGPPEGPPPSFVELKSRAASLDEERRALETGISADYLNPFLKVARQRKGLALVAVRDERCGGCHVRVMPKLIQQVRRATGLIACDSCKRFLYVPDDPPRSTVAAAESPAQ